MVKKFTSGFALIEILVVITVIGILISVVVFSTSRTQKHDRDAQRKAEVGSIRNALALYNADHDQYPDPGSDLTATSLEGSNWIPGLVPDYIKNLPKDPRQARLFTSIAGLFKSVLSNHQFDVEAATNPVTIKLMVVIYNPIIESQGNKRLNQVMGWNDPDVLTAQLINDLRTASHGIVNYEITKRVELDKWPVTVNGSSYTDASFFQDPTYSGLGNGDYNAIIAENQIAQEVNSGNVDEVFLWGAPGFGWWESAMAGNGAFWINGGPIYGVNSKAFVLMGLNYERGVAEALESYGHRTESIMRKVYGSWVAGAQSNNWEKFAEQDQNSPGNGGLGNAHNAFNAEPGTDYNRTSTRTLLTSADDWYNFPNMTGAKTNKNCTAWGCSAAGYLLWWYDHMPHFSGQVNGISNNWWEYIVGFNDSIINASSTPSLPPSPPLSSPSPTSPPPPTSLQYFYSYDVTADLQDFTLTVVLEAGTPYVVTSDQN